LSAPAETALSSHIPSAGNCSYPVRAGNFIRPLIDGEAAFSRICEAVDAARSSVWVTVAFLNSDFRMPDGRSFFDVLDGAAARGLDVRVIFWRTHLDGIKHFHGHAEDHAFLAMRGSKFLARWDRAQKHYCQHQKSWLIDAGHTGEIAFVGGINLTNSSVSAAGHANRGGRHTHDIYVELRGPSASDVHHNFVQRWNEASERESGGGLWAHGREHVLDFPARTSPAAGRSIVQMQRTVRAGHYTDGRAAPDARAFDIAGGERSVFEQYVAAIDAAKRTIYIEDQYVVSPDIVEHLHLALARGVAVTFLAPAEPEEQIKQSRLRPDAKPLYERLAALGVHEKFLLAGIASPRTGEAVYVHAKVMLIDDCWATIGSCNIASRSFFGDTELNASIWDVDIVRRFRVDLLSEHLGIDTGGMNDTDAFARYRELARAKAHNAFVLDPATYAS
jgi:cardiolipin synthase A/B